MTLSIRIKNMNLSINDHQHYETRHLVSLCSVVLSIFMLIVVMLKKTGFSASIHISFSRHHCGQNNGIQHNDTQHNNKKHNSHHLQSSALRDSASSVIVLCHVVHFHAEKTGFWGNLSAFLSSGTTTLRIMALRITIKNTTLRLYDHLHYETRHFNVILLFHVIHFYADCRYAEKQVFAAIDLHSFLAVPWHWEKQHPA